MLDKNKIYEFCLVCLIKLEKQNLTYIELIDYVCDEFESLGIKMDEGKSFFDRYGNALNDSNELKKIINEINSVHLLGSAIYSYCMNININYNLNEEIVEEKNRKWLSLAFTRLSILTKKPDNVLQGVLKKICIISNNITYGPNISSNEEVKQKLTINDNGQVYFKGYSLKEELNQYEIIRTKTFKINEKDINKLFHAIYCCFSIPKFEPKTTDCGEWLIVLTNMEGETFKFEGSFDTNLLFEGENLSLIVRNALCMNDLYVFDGECKCDIINKIMIDYHRVLKVKSYLLNDCDHTKITTFNDKEHLIIDRISKTIELIRESDSGYRVNYKYEFKDGLDRFFDYFSTKDFFSKVKGNPSDVIIDPNDTHEYKINIEYKDNSKKFIEGSFDKYGLPTDFEEFANVIVEIMIEYGESDILNSDFFGFVRPCASDYIICSVSFDNTSKTYYYLGDENIRIDDCVIVPTGSENTKRVGIVKKIEYYKEENLPFPKLQLKKIISINSEC